MAALQAVQSSGDAQLSQSRAVPLRQAQDSAWLPIKMIYPLVAHKRPRLESYYP